MKYLLGFRFVLTSYFSYLIGGFLSAFLVITNNRVGAVLAVLIPTIGVAIFISVIVRQVKQPRKKKLVVRKASRISKVAR
jgi:UDP-N-acetylmuramyl pentapeptide phosphotransferase/UDP-N-acetylglucosamine-1-phosphate transferase